MTITTTPPVRPGAKGAPSKTVPVKATGATPVKERPARRGTPPRGPERVPKRGATPAPARKPAAKAPARTAAPHAPRMPFAMLVIGLLGGALISLLMLRTVLAEDAFQLTKLQQNNKLLAQHEEALSQEVARAESPAEIARKAREGGMRPAPGGFVNEATGQVRGGTTTPARPVTPGGGAVDPRIAAGEGRSTSGDAASGGATAGGEEAGGRDAVARNGNSGTTGGTTGGGTTGETNDGSTGDTSDDGAIAGGGGR